MMKGITWGERMIDPLVICILFFFIVLIFSELINSFEKERTDAHPIVPEPWTIYKKKGSEEE